MRAVTQSVAKAARAFGMAMAIVVALIAVGLTASPDGPFSIAVTPVPHRLGIDLDVKVLSIHLHTGWSALPSTKPASGDF